MLIGKNFWHLQQTPTIQDPQTPPQPFEYVFDINLFLFSCKSPNEFTMKQL